MARPMSNGRTSLSPTEREVAGAMFALVAQLRRDGRLSDDEIMTAATWNLELADDIEYPARALHEATETTEEWIDVQRARSERLEDLAPQAVAEVAAEFGVRLELDGVWVRKWGGKAPA
jgi:hypothetical protein